MALKQVYNSRSKKWVLYDDAKRSGIIKMQSEPFEGIEKNGDTYGFDEADKSKKAEPGADDVRNTPPEKEPEKKVDDVEEDEIKKPDKSPGGWLNVLGL